MAGKNVICLELGKDVVRAAEVSLNRNTFEITAAVKFSIPGEYVSDGMIMDAEKVAGHIMPKLDEAGFRSDRIIFSIVSGKVMNKEMTIPTVKKSQLGAVVRNQAEELFPMGIDGQALSYSINSVDRVTKMTELIVYAIPEEMMVSYYELAEAMGKQVQSLDYCGNAVYQWMKRAFGNQSVLSVRIDGSGSQLTIMAKNQLEMQRNVNYGSNDLLDAAVDLGLAQDRKGAFEIMSRDDYIASSLDDVPEEADDITRLRSDIAYASRDLLSNVSRFIDYFYNMRRDASYSIEEIVLIGEGSKLLGLKELFDTELGIRTVIGGESESAVVYKGTGRAEVRDYLYIVGAVADPVGFITEEQVEKESAAFRKRAGKRLIVIVCGICGAVLLLNLLFWGYLSYHNRSLKDEAERLSYILTVQQEYENAKEANQQAKQIDRLSTTDGDITLRMLRELEGDLPSSCVVKALNVEDNIVTIGIAAPNRPVVADTILQIKNLGYINGDSLTVSNYEEKIDSRTGVRMVETTMTAFFFQDAAEIAEQSGELPGTDAEGEAEEDTTPEDGSDTGNETEGGNDGEEAAE
ncbi:MAG: pilus assembly protein PilM [Clostridia bacterium]|nr:pilus assembly protein PilM [Clostridia bacterium]